MLASKVLFVDWEYYKEGDSKYIEKLSGKVLALFKDNFEVINTKSEDIVILYATKLRTDNIRVFCCC